MRHSRRRSKNSSLAVTLFPFLAVLICTMGILVALLVVAVRAADVQAREDADGQRNEKLAQIDELQMELDESQFREEGLSEFRPDVVNRLKEARDRRAHVLTNIQNLEATAESLARQYERLDEKPEDAPKTLDEMDGEIAELKNRILAGQEQLETLQKQKPIENIVYSIVPTEATGTTSRRPIYIECVDNRLILQPHGIELTAKDFVRPIEPGNPLDAAMISVREYWNEFNLSGSDGDPYPLLVIRPSGARAYALARHAIQSWDDEFGYELVGENLELDFGIRDRQLEDRLKLAVADSKSRQRLVQRQPVYASNARVGSGNGRAGGNGLGPQYTGLTQDSAQGGFNYQGAGYGEDPLESPLGYARNGFAESDSTTSDRNRAGQAQENSAYANQSNSETSQGQQWAGNSQGQSGTGGSSSMAGSPVESLAQTRGRDWALPSRTEGGNVYRRPIKISCSANELAIQSGASLDRQAKLIPLNQSTAQAVDPLINVVWSTIESWGFAGAGGYWKPELRIHVLEGGQRRAEELAVLLDNSGLDIQLIEAR